MMTLRGEGRYASLSPNIIIIIIIIIIILLQGFSKHYHNDHNIYSYIYFILHIKSMSSHDHNAIEKYVNDKVQSISLMM